jgi:hypothetical protein
MLLDPVREIKERRPYGGRESKISNKDVEKRPDLGEF